MSSSAHATLPRLASLVRLLLQLRMLLAAFALLLIPGERLTPPPSCSSSPSPYSPAWPRGTGSGSCPTCASIRCSSPWTSA
ncbi:hypothetical protein ACFQXA_31975 [Nocardiopsis composta]